LREIGHLFRGLAHPLFLGQHAVARRSWPDVDDLAHLAELFDAVQQNEINHRAVLHEARGAAVTRARPRTGRAPWRPITASRTCRPAYRKRSAPCRDAAAAVPQHATRRARRGRTAPTAR